MPKAISYIRFSTGRQSLGSSHERQRQAVTRWLEKHPDYTLYDKPYDDLGRSGYSGDHVDNAFGRLLAAIEDGTIPKGSTILIEQIDRVGRMEPFEMFPLLSRIVNAGVDLVTLDDGITYNRQSVNNNHLFLLVAKVQAAWGYSKTLSERTKASYAIRREKAKNGEPIKRFAVAWLTTDGKLKSHLVPYVKQVFDLYISGVGKNTIANRLRASGMPELASISSPTIDAWLQNKTAIGFWNDIPGVYKPVVTPEVFMQAQKRRQEVKTQSRSRTSKNFLVGMVKCGVCNANYIIHNKEGKPNNMRCLTRHRLKDAGCTNSETIPYQVVHFIYLSSAPSWIDKAMKVIQLTDNEKRKLYLVTEREELTASILRMAKLLARTDSPELESEFDLANERRASIDIELSVLDRKADNGVESKSTSIFVGYEATLEHDRLAFHDPIQLSALLKQAGYSITVQPGRKLYVAESNVPWVYTGVARKGNTTLGYRIQDGEMEYTISNVIPEAVDVQAYKNNPDGEMQHVADRSYKHVKSPTLLNPTGLRNTNVMTIEKFESANAAMQRLTSGV